MKKSQGPFAPNNAFEENLTNYIKHNKLKTSRNAFIKTKGINNKENINYKYSFFSSTNREQ